MNISERYRLYKINKNDSLESVASHFRITKDELRDYHNMYCPKGMYIISSFPKELTHLYVYPNLDVLANEGLPKVEYDLNNALIFKPSKTILKYHCEYNLQNDLHVIKINYDLEIQFLKRANNYQLLFQLDRNNFTINNNPPGSFMESLAHQCGNALYPLEVLIDDKGSFVGVNNHQEILNRWLVIKQNILKFYNSDFLEDYLDLNEENLKNVSKLNRMIQSDWFLSLYFNQLYTPLSMNYTSEKLISFPIDSHVKPANFRVVQSTQKYFETNKKLPLKIHGYLEDERGNIEFDSQIDERMFDKESSPLAKGDYQVEYLFNDKYQIEKIEAIITLNTKAIKILDTKINLIN